MASVVDLDRVRRNDDRLSTLQLILSGTVDLDALKEVLRVNTKVAEVIIYVDESFLVELPVADTQDLFATIGGLPNLQKLGFHSQSGSSGVLSVPALIAITSHAARMVHFGISDVALWGSRSDFQQWATQLQTQLFLQSFCVCECELLEPSQDCPLDPILTVLSILPSLEALFLQAAAPNGLGELSPEAVGSIGMAPQLQDLRLGNFALQNPHIVQLSKVLPYNRVLLELKLDACREFLLETAHALAKILQHNRRLKSLELGMTSMMTDECAVVVAQSLHYNTALESFTLSRCAATRFRPTLSPVCQQAFVDMLHQNYALETLVLFQRFPVKKEFKLYLTLNKYGRGKLLMSETAERSDWVNALHKVSDDLDSIYYYLRINPNLCRHCDDDDDDQDDNDGPAAAAEVGAAEKEWITGDPSTIVSNLLFHSMCKKRSASVVAEPPPPLEQETNAMYEYIRQHAAEDSTLLSPASASAKRARTASEDREDSTKMAAVPSAAAHPSLPLPPESVLDLAAAAVAGPVHHPLEFAALPTSAAVLAAAAALEQQEAAANLELMALATAHLRQQQAQQQQQQFLVPHPAPAAMLSLQEQLEAALQPASQVAQLRHLLLLQQHQQQAHQQQQVQQQVQQLQQLLQGQDQGSVLSALSNLQLLGNNSSIIGSNLFAFGRPGL